MGKRQKRPNPQHDPVYAELCRRLKAVRKDAGLTMVELGEAFRRPHTFVHKVESGDRRIDPVEFCRWCQACGADPATVLKPVAKQAAKSPPL